MWRTRIFLRSFCQLYGFGLGTYIQINEKKKTFQDPKKTFKFIFTYVVIF